MLNLLGFACYSSYNVALAYVPAVRTQYREAYSDTIPVGLEDVIFAVHALIATSITLTQCIVYDRGEQTFWTPVGKGAMVLGGLCALAVAVVAAMQSSVKGEHGEWTHTLNWVNLLLALSVCKLAVSLVKYIPQVRT
jgi:cystinosin